MGKKRKFMEFLLEKVEKTVVLGIISNYLFLFDIWICNHDRTVLMISGSGYSRHMNDYESVYQVFSELLVVTVQNKPLIECHLILWNQRCLWCTNFCVFRGLTNLTHAANINCRCVYILESTKSASQ